MIEGADSRACLQKTMWWPATSVLVNGSNVYWHATAAMLQIENNLTNVEPGFVRLPQEQAKATDFNTPG